MEEIVFLSGKGGTGKTSIVASLANLVQNKVLADADVDAPDLHILLHPEIKEEKEFYGNKKAFIMDEKCIGCGLCMEVCRFDAIESAPRFKIKESLCEGCAYCVEVCPQKAIIMKDNISGKIFVSETKYGPFVHAVLLPGEENSGKLVSEVRIRAKKIAEERNLSYVLIDGSPGIGCPVIASITAADKAVIITEPTQSGLHDLKRILDLVWHFKIKPFAVINKYDLSEKVSLEIEEYLKDVNVPLLSKVPYDESFIHALKEKKTLIEYGKGMALKSITELKEKLFGG